MPKKVKQLYVVFAICTVLVIGFMISPLTVPLWNQIYPRIGGIPLSEVFIWGAAALLFVICNVFFYIEGKMDEKEEKMRKAGEKIEY